MTLAHTFMVALNQMPDGKPHTLEVLVDTKGLYEEVLRRMLAVEDAIDWSTYFLGGMTSFSPPPKKHYVISMNSGYLNKFCDLEPRLSPSSLNESHVELVNRSWKFGCVDSKLMIKNMILNFPSCCVLDSDDQPVAWILTYASCALGMLYTLPEHRGKGYAKALITIMSKRLHSQGYPVYCFIEEENHLSYSLFTSLGFTEEPDYRAAWFVFNDF
uniref:Glycine N-acyltransferase-like protein n=1 Tax=Sinocyclocheilus grahami TaxID=75366 RepID=A0A672MSH3_SINGR